MNADKIRTLVVDRLNFLVDRPLAEDLANLLANPDFVGGNLLLSGIEMTASNLTHTPLQRYVTDWTEVSA